MKIMHIVIFALAASIWKSGNAEIKNNFNSTSENFTVTPLTEPSSEQPLLSPNTSSQLDVAFIMDSTGSMSSYIEEVRQNIRKFVDAITLNATNSTNDVLMSLVEYRDHPPEDHTFVTRKHDFTPEVSVMKSWLDAASADGGGDTPEAVADALFEATKLSWRRDSVKIGILVSDAPPHGLSPSEDNSFPQGCPKGHDPVNLTRELVKLGVTIYSVGCEPSILPYKDFFMALAYVTGGQYIPLSDPQRLIDAIIGGAREQLSLQFFAEDVKLEIQNAKDFGEPINEEQIIQRVYQKLNTTGAQSTHLLRNNQALEGPSSGAKAIAAANSMAEVRNLFRKGEKIVTSERHLPMAGKVMYPAEASYGESFGLSPMADASVNTGTGVGETYNAVEAAVSMDQISRLVKNQVAQSVVK